MTSGLKFLNHKLPGERPHKRTVDEHKRRVHSNGPSWCRIEAPTLDTAAEYSKRSDESRPTTTGYSRPTMPDPR
jgi:hypothetical protein